MSVSINEQELQEKSQIIITDKILWWFGEHMISLQKQTGVPSITCVMSIAFSPVVMGEIGVLLVTAEPNSDLSHLIKKIATLHFYSFWNISHQHADILYVLRS